MDHDKPIKRLESLFAKYRLLPIPKGGGQLAQLEDADVDLYVEDGYLAGLVSVYLTTHQISVEEIRLDGTIDLRIEKAHRTSPDNKTVDDFLSYRKGMHELATALSEISGVQFKLEGQD